MFSKLYLIWRYSLAARFFFHLVGLIECLSEMFPGAPSAIYLWATLQNLIWLKELGVLIFETIQEAYAKSDPSLTLLHELVLRSVNTLLSTIRFDFDTQTSPMEPPLTAAQASLILLYQKPGHHRRSPHTLFCIH
ncbi:unnamed protein product [Fusarium graminearum]|nr:unnamed protein product [Fusarium graminearum]